jgi:hypothetical protein
MKEDITTPGPLGPELNIGLDSSGFGDAEGTVTRQRSTALADNSVGRGATKSGKAHSMLDWEAS